MEQLRGSFWHLARFASRVLFKDKTRDTLFRLLAYSQRRFLGRPQVSVVVQRDKLYAVDGSLASSWQEAACIVTRLAVIALSA